MPSNRRRIRASALCFDSGRWLTVRLRDPHSHTLYCLPPGGEIAPGETPAAAAVRETLEETGFTVVVQPDSELILDYVFRWGGAEVDCRTHFFFARLQTQPATPAPPFERESYIEGHDWLAVKELLASTANYGEWIRPLEAWILKYQREFEAKN